MVPGLFIRGGWATLPNNGQCYTGLPSRFGGGPFYPRFPIADRSAAYEWVMALHDQHPYAHWIANLFGQPGDLTAHTLAGLRARERAIDGVLPHPNGLYRELRREFETRHLDPLRCEWCNDRPDVLDFTRCIFGLEQVLPLVKRRGDEGWLIRKLLAVYREPEAPGPNSLRQAPASKIRIALTAVYAEVKVLKKKPPNVNEVVDPVKDKLEAAGYQASAAEIRRVAGEDVYKRGRLRPGITIASMKSQLG